MGSDIHTTGGVFGEPKKETLLPSSLMATQPLIPTSHSEPELGEPPANHEHQAKRSGELRLATATRRDLPAQAKIPIPPLQSRHEALHLRHLRPELPIFAADIAHRLP